MAGGRIIVGIDGSAHAKAALEWAMEEARMRDACVAAVHAWQFPSIALTEYGGAAMPVLTMDEVEKASEAMARATVDEIAGDSTTPHVALIVRHGNPAQVLVEEAKGAEMLVVGSRGHGGFRGMLLGSVSTNVVHHAVCPVVVIHRPRDGETARKT